MKEYINKIIQTSTAIIIACILVYGVVYVQQVRCGTIADTCISTSNKISVSYNIDSSCKLSPSHILNNQLQLNLCSKNFLTDFGSGNSCCETGRCDGYNQVTEFSLSFIQGFFSLQKNENSFDAGNGAQDRFKPYNLSTPHKAVPIYILIESIIC